MTPAIRLAALLRTVCVLLCCMLFAGSAGSGQPAPQSKPPFRAETELVTVDVVVLDKDGEPISDLTAADFTISEDGRPQNVQFFQPVIATAGRRESPRFSSSPTHPPTSSPAEKLPSAPAEKLPSSPAPQLTSSPADQRYSTNVGVHARPTRSFVLFFDDVHLTQEQGERAKSAIERFLKDEAHDGDLISLVAPGRALRWHARLPDGRAALVKALQLLRGSRVPDVAHERVSDYEAYRIHVLNDEQMAERVGRRFSNYRVGGRDPVNLQRDQGPRPEKKGGAAGLIEPFVLSRATEAYTRAAARNRVVLGALSDTIQSMAPVRGRKSIILISPGFILDQELTLYRQVEDTARRANTALYFVDARGLEAQSGFATAQFGSPLDARDIGAANADIALEAEGATALADASGGFSVQNRNDLAAGLRRIGRESRAYYLLGYMPPDRRGDGKLRRISVEVARPRVQVRARSGYYAGESSAAPKTSDEHLEVALDSPYDLAALPVRAAAFVFGRVNATETSVLLAVEADLRAFELTPVNGTFTDVLDLRLLVTDLSTGETRRHERAVEMNLQGRVPSAETSAWYPLTQSFELPAGRYQARVAVRDRNSGRVGAVTHDFDVPARTGLSVSSLIVTDTIEKAAAPGSSLPPRPVLIVRRLLTPNTTLYYQFSVFDAGRGENGETRVRAGHVLRRADGSVLKELPPAPLVAGQNGMSRFAGISLAGVAPDDYELIVTVIDDVRGETVVVREAFGIAQPGPQ